MAKTKLLVRIAGAERAIMQSLHPFERGREQAESPGLPAMRAVSANPLTGIVFLHRTFDPKYNQIKTYSRPLMRAIVNSGVLRGRKSPGLHSPGTGAVGWVCRLLHRGGQGLFMRPF